MKDKAYSSIWSINYVFEIIKNTCFSIALIIAKNDRRDTVIQGLDDTNILEKPF
jgi:hypothetical protein